MAIKHADGGVPGQGLAVILGQPSEQVLEFQATLLAVATPFAESGGTAAAFVTDPGEEISQSTHDWVERYVTAQIGPGKYTAGITVGVLPPPVHGRAPQGPPGRGRARGARPGCRSSRRTAPASVGHGVRRADVLGGPAAVADNEGQLHGPGPHLLVEEHECVRSHGVRELCEPCRQSVVTLRSAVQPPDTWLLPTL
ncbi:hypothetical protein [Streptomyces sp. NPDC102487]|uniref:hypothetical protein n=1 Tax=Streptomyces sp. NPDC102487 TaxID=3366182 RepID=UPI0038135DDD